MRVCCESPCNHPIWPYGYSSRTEFSDAALRLHSGLGRKLLGISERKLPSEHNPIRTDGHTPVGLQASS